MRTKEQQRWDRDLREQPWTLLIFFPTMMIFGGGIIFVGFFLDGARLAWTIWGLIMIILFAILGATFRLERKGSCVAENKRLAWKILWCVGCVLALGCLTVAVFPKSFVTMRVRLSAIGLLCGLATGGGALRALLRK